MFGQSYYETCDSVQALYDCPLYDGGRGTYVELRRKYPQVTQIFNPVDVVDACLLGKFLIDIETVREEQDLNWSED